MLFEKIVKLEQSVLGSNLLAPRVEVCIAHACVKFNKTLYSRIALAEFFNAIDKISNQLILKMWSKCVERNEHHQKRVTNLHLLRRHF